MKKALIIGINNYPKAPLTGCLNDASSMATVLATNGDGSPNFGVRLETDVPTKSEVKKMITELYAGDSDIAIFYFSGHGDLNPYGGYIVTPDAKQFDEGVSMDEILTIANAAKAKNKIIILDCCYSGTFGTPQVIGRHEALLSEGLTILTASGKEESSQEVNGHGVFTNLLIDALQGGAADITGNITPGSIYAYIDQALGPWDQRPAFKTHTTQFVSLRDIPPKVSLDILRLLPKYFTSATDELSLNPSYEFTNKSANPKNVTILKNLQKFESVGLVLPVGEEHMYFAAMNSKTCKLSALGHHYWRLAKTGKL